MKNAHAKLAADFASGKKEVAQEVWEELLQLNYMASRVSQMLD